LTKIFFRLRLNKHAYQIILQKYNSEHNCSRLQRKELWQREHEEWEAQGKAMRSRMENLWEKAGGNISQKYTGYGREEVARRLTEDGAGRAIVAISIIIKHDGCVLYYLDQTDVCMTQHLVVCCVAGRKLL
jgi:hypothetical protein